MDDNELDWLALHLGHIELATVSKLLIAGDQGKAYKYAGKKLNDITVPGM